ncbi:MAG: ImmA/IrrE family metallo-endopeptidase [Bradyrhizobium sp.]|uniref:ImmA/IrrE family metallo-endopeptidase n=1 Tax=Bradyrhizobium sp. TaxID=376 RepID=UPI0011F76229|nr:ImmA/IrrE family metallo-endopeptidase [Bradyrhizobium sp.]THD59581.1 MAG: ImmA/IrrE family metallo-endopeptidase [Bradyrhizobium sp.]
MLQELGITEPGEIDLEAIAFHLGARVRYRKLEGCEARIIGRNEAAIITIGKDCSDRRKRFSLAHEIGHWTHHKGQTLVCRVEESAPQGKMSPERVANNYAADLLMPHYLFGPAARVYPKLNFKAVNDIADIFHTSRSATAIRLVEGGHSPALLVCHGLKGRKWFARGPDVPPRWFPRDDLDADSFAFGVLFGKKPDDPMPRKIDAEAWFDRRDAGKFAVHEQTIRSATDEILTLVLINDPEMLEDE